VACARKCAKLSTRAKGLNFNNVYSGGCRQLHRQAWKHARRVMKSLETRNTRLFIVSIYHKSETSCQCFCLARSLPRRNIRRCEVFRCLRLGPLSRAPIEDWGQSRQDHGKNAFFLAGPVCRSVPSINQPAD
jgi:hypothetical protein